MRVSAMLAVLDGRNKADAPDWELAGTYWEVSAGVRDWMARFDANEEVAREAGVRDRLSGRAAHIKSEDEKREALLTRAVGYAERHVRKEPAVKLGCKGASISGAVLPTASRHRSGRS